MKSKKVGELIRIEIDEDGTTRMIIEITDLIFKNRILHNKNLIDLITLKGKDAIIVASKSKEK